MQYLFTSSSSVPYVLAIILLALIGFASTQEVLLREGNHFEVYRQLEVNEAWGVNFQVASGTIFFRLISSDGVIHENASETYGSYALTAKKAGRHSFRFENRVNPGMPPVKVSFRILGDEKAMAASDGGNLEKLDPVLTELRHLNNLLRSSRDEHAFFMDREVEHRNRAIKIKSRIMWWFLSQSVLLAGVCYFQISSLKKFFEVRRLV